MVDEGRKASPRFPALAVQKQRFAGAASFWETWWKDRALAGNDKRMTALNKRSMYASLGFYREDFVSTTATVGAAA